MNFYIPDFYNFFSINIMLVSMIKNEPELFNDIKIGAVYGSFPMCKWDGGRYMYGTAIDPYSIENIVSTFNEAGIPIRFTFTNCFVGEEHLNDRYCNMIADIGHNGMNEILVNSPILEQYLRATYPRYKFISSTTKCLNAYELEKELTKDYRLVVADSSLNHTDELFDISDKSRVELLVNHYCVPNCPKRKKHYEEVSRANLGSVDNKANCQHILRSFWDIKEHNSSFISVDDIFGKYSDAGFKHFKLDGRGFSIVDLIDSYVYYLVKPKYYDIVKNRILKVILQ